MDLHCLPLSKWIYSNNSDQVIWLAEKKKWVWHLNLFSRTRVNCVQLYNVFFIPFLQHFHSFFSNIYIVCLLFLDEHQNTLELGFQLWKVAASCFYYIYPKYSDRQPWANSVDPDQMPQNVASDLSTQCLLPTEQFLGTKKGSKMFVSFFFFPIFTLYVYFS